MKRFWAIIFAFMLLLSLTACGCDHEWYAATCSSAKACSICGATEGEPLPHTWVEATCTEAKVCSVCNVTEGEALPHMWKDATCTEARVCSVCNATDGEPLGHSWQGATCITPKTCSVCKVTEGKVAAHTWLEATTEAPQTCSVCKATTGTKLKTDPRFTTAATKHLHGEWYCDVTLTDEMMNLENFGGTGVRLTLKIGNTGELSQTIGLKDEKGFLTKLKAYTVEKLYADFATEGFSREQGDQAMLQTYGLNVNDYVEAALKSYDVNAMFKAFTFEEVYYVEGGEIYTAISWKATFEKSAYSLTSGKLRVDGLSLEDGGPQLIWTKK